MTTLADIGLSIAGERESKEDVRSSNVTAVMALSNVLRTSLGPHGLDKMLVDDVGEVSVTNDGATILQRLSVEHPAAKVLVDLAGLQDSEVGDGTTSVCLVATELLKRANELVNNSVHPTTIISTYRQCMKAAVKAIKDISVPVNGIDDEVLYAIAKTSLASKVLKSEIEFFAKLVVNAARSTKAGDKYPFANVNILKQHGGSALESHHSPDGYVISGQRTADAMPMLVQGAKIALVDFDLKKFRLGLGTEIRLESAEEVEHVRQKEMDLTKTKINAILDAGANVVFTTKGIDDMALKYFVGRDVLTVRRVEKSDMKKVAKLTGARIQLTLATLDEGETMDPTALGCADKVIQRRFGDNEYVCIEGCAGGRASTVVLRGPSEFFLDEAERAFHDAICVVCRTLESKNVVPGGGACEVCAALELEKGAPSPPQEEFAAALLCIPAQLAKNAAKDAPEAVAALKAAHAKGQKHAGLDLTNGGVQNAVEAGVVEPLISKVKSLKFATEAAITLLRIDDCIRLAPEGDDQQQQYN